MRSRWAARERAAGACRGACTRAKVDVRAKRERCVCLSSDVDLLLRDADDLAAFRLRGPVMEPVVLVDRLRLVLLGLRHRDLGAVACERVSLPVDVHLVIVSEPL